MILDRDALLGKLELKKEVLVIDDGEEVIISELGAKDLMDLYTRKGLHDDAGDIVMAKFTPALVAMSIVDNDGNRIFSDEDIPLFEKAAASLFGKLSAAARRLNGLAGDETKN